MKFYILLACISVQILLTSSKVLPNKFPQFCPISTPNYNKCMEKVFAQMGPLLLKGVREINFPKFLPLELISLSVNRTVNDYMKVLGEFKNLQFWGFDKLRLESYQFDPQTLEGKLNLTMPYMSSKMEYDMQMSMFGFDIDNIGFIAINSTIVDLNFIFKFNKYEKSGVEYLGFDNFVVKSTYDDAEVEAISKDHASQPAVDLILDFYNQDHKRYNDGIHPIYEGILTLFYKSVVDQVFSSMPAKEFFPE